MKESDLDILFKSKDKTNSRYGKRPEDRNLEELLQKGIVNIDKPRGPTSHEVTSWVKKILGISKAGHSGTLDPNVSGVLPVTLGKATKLVKLLMTSNKEYVCTMHLQKDVDKKDLMRILKEYEGNLYQKPPVKSAVKRRVRTRKVHYIDPIEIQSRDVLMRVGCDAGTYIRKLCYDMGLSLGCGATMEELRRTKTGIFTEDSTILLQDLLDASIVSKEEKNEEILKKLIVPYETVLDPLKKIWVKDTAVEALCQGAMLTAPGVSKLNRDIKKGDTVAIMTLKNEAISISDVEMTSEEIMLKEQDIVAKPTTVLMEPGIYPRTWN
ncbi:MAG TPA: RNA-guided pseudouridylation complex pseudouridine synthase subunit Cbf5 [Methanofastidiosum sp.]|nr:RNA-guided pseudouridylation complex pseudouridine synthase subunit Cbf5 [Methanofastidiosum sp.]HOG74042.1 RNA-guided pseudouridylation complex pseudouridine synthase subunit Cbf5 [Methanofastidiosum sp.]HRZ19268.1 RNA-guided pseudouridylation complex pseudouridine synthase subunit Cbf5 [Methanofastidiosum sp.]